MAKRSFKADTVGKVTAVMELLCSSDGTYSLREIESLTGIPKSTLHRLLKSLEREEWVYADPETERYRPGVRFFLLHNEKLFHQALINTSSPEMERLVRETEKTAILSVLEGSVGLCIHHVEPSSPVKYVAHRGMTIPLHVSATGKVLLAFSPKDLQERIISSCLPSDVDAYRLISELEKIKSDGFAYSREEWITHAGDISVPLFDSRGTFVAQLGLAGLAASFDGQKEAIAQMLKEASRRIGSKL
jgi:DNA-binding IclR family transcriptional regulator